MGETNWANLFSQRIIARETNEGLRISDSGMTVMTNSTEGNGSEDDVFQPKLIVW